VSELGEDIVFDCGSGVKGGGPCVSVNGCLVEVEIEAVAEEEEDVSNRRFVPFVDDDDDDDDDEGTLPPSTVVLDGSRRMYPSLI
jgi:hypothetical protein